MHISSASILVQVSVMDRPAQDRKRKASHALRELATELQVKDRGRNNDFTKAQFASLLEHVEVQCSTPDQRRRAQAAKALYFETATLPPVPALPVFASGASASSAPPSSAVPLPQLESEVESEATEKKEFL